MLLGLRGFQSVGLALVVLALLKGLGRVRIMSEVLERLSQSIPGPCAIVVPAGVVRLVAR